MIFENGKYYHVYNRTNNKELLFRDEENYSFFLAKTEKHLISLVSIISYCLMPTHFHILLRCETETSADLSNAFAVVLRSYTRAINKRFGRTGSLFQQNTKAKEITDERYLLTLISYIHQNPLRAHLVSTLNEWKYSSYRQIAGDSPQNRIRG